MKLLAIGKFPPIQGGVSSQMYWSMKGLAQRGHQVDVITNALEVESYFRLKSENTKLHTNNLKIHFTEALSNNSHIPFSQAYLTKLLGLASELCDSNNYDLIYGYYFEPYSIAASIIGELNGIPSVITHAGSDITYLTEFSSMCHAFKLATKHSTKIILTGGSSNTSLCEKLSIDENKILKPSLPRLPNEFSKYGEKTNLKEMASRIDSTYFGISKLDKILNILIKKSNSKNIADSAPQIAMYGKIDEAKGSFDLLDALDRIADEGLDFCLNIICTGTPDVLLRYFKVLSEKEFLLNRVRILPSIHPEEVPKFLRSIDVSCFLEREFPVAMHRPNIPREVLASGCALVVSQEIANNQIFSKSLVDGKNMVVVKNPKNIDELASKIRKVISNKDFIKELGYWGNCLSKSIESQLVDISYFEEILLNTAFDKQSNIMTV